MLQAVTNNLCLRRYLWNDLNEDEMEENVYNFKCQWITVKPAYNETVRDC